MQAVYDLVKQVDPALTISDIRLEVKEGGKSGLWRHPNAVVPSARPPSVAERNRPTEGRAAVITVSDRCFNGRATDVSGKVLHRGLISLGFKTAKPVIVPDEKEIISNTIKRLSRQADVVALTGGTGLSPRASRA